jgi:hypothetical protein
VVEASKSYFYFNDDYDVEDSTAKADISEFIIHPDWDPKETHYRADIAIAVLRRSIKLSNKIRHVCLNDPSNPVQSFAGHEAMVYGWGLSEEFLFLSELRDVSVPLVDQALCNSSNSNLPKIISDSSFCAGARDGKTGACNGIVC